MSQPSRIRAAFAVVTKGRVLVSAAVGCVLIIGAFFASTSTASAQSVTSRSIIAFSQAEPDTAVEAFILRHNLRVEAVYLWTAGFTGTHRSYTSTSAASLLAAARRESVKLFANAIQSNLRQMDGFVSSHSETDLAASASLAAEARSILNNHTQLKLALATASEHGALVYALEAIGASSRELGAISRDPVVSAVATKEGPKTGGLLKPTAYQAERRDPAIAALGADELRARMRAVLSNSAEEVVR